MRDDELQHYGIPGQKWGRRRFQYEDGTLTEAGKRRYYVVNKKNSTTAKRETVYKPNSTPNPNYPNIHTGTMYLKETSGPFAGLVTYASHYNPHSSGSYTGFPHHDSQAPVSKPNSASIAPSYLGIHTGSSVRPNEEDNKKEDKKTAIYQKQVDQKVKEIIKDVKDLKVSELVKDTGELLSTMFKTDNPFGYLWNSITKAFKK